MKTKIHATLLMVAIAAAFAGCASTPSERIAANPQLFASIPPANQQLIKQGQIAIGFTPNMVRLALGEPDAVTQHIDATGTTETWRYQSSDSNTRAYVYTTWRPYYGPYFYPGARLGYWGSGWGYPGAYWDWQPARTDYLRVSFRNGVVAEINRLR